MNDLYLVRGVTPEPMAAAFLAAGALWRAAPWRIVMTDDSLISVTSPELGLRDAVVSIVGQHRSIFGFMLFPGGVGDFGEFERRAATHGIGALGSPPLLSLTFVHRDEISSRARRETERHGWPLPDPSKYPLFGSLDGFTNRGASPTELATLEAVALGLVKLVADEPNLEGATFGTSSFDRTFAVTTHGGGRSLQFRAPCVPPPMFDDDDEAREDLVELPLPTRSVAPRAAPAPSADDLRKARNRRTAERQARR